MLENRADNRLVTRKSVLSSKLALVELARPRAELSQALAIAGELDECPGNSRDVIAPEADATGGALDESLNVAVGPDV